MSHTELELTGLGSSGRQKRNQTEIHTSMAEQRLPHGNRRGQKLGTGRETNSAEDLQIERTDQKSQQTEEQKLTRENWS
jgi:hypothetical protein